MQVTVREQVWSFSNDASGMDELNSKLDAYIEQHGYYITCMIINGYEIYEEFRERIEDQLSQIQTIEVGVSTADQLKDEVMLSLEQYLDRAIPEVSILSTELYQGSNNDSWDKFTQLVEGLQWIYSMIGSIDKIENKSMEWTKYVSVIQQLDEVLKNMDEPVQNKDFIQMGDILTYELLPILRSLHENLKESINHKVVNKYVN